MDDPWKRRTFTSALFYRDPKAALAWLGEAFGLETLMVITDDAGAIAHAEMSYGDGQVMIGSEWAANTKSPASIGGANTQMIHVQLPEGLDAHCERARAAGAVIVAEPEEQFYGDRTYRAVDLEGHVWTFGQAVRAVSREEAEAASGLKIEGWI